MSESGVVESIGAGQLFGSILIKHRPSSLGGLLPDMRRPLYAGSQKSPYTKIQLGQFDLILQRPDGSEIGTASFGSTIILPYDQAQTLLASISGGDALATFVETVDDPAPPTTSYPVHVLGTVGGEPVVATPGVSLNPGATQTVTIGGTDYIMSAPPPGWPGRPPAGTVYSYPRTISAGTQVELLQPEAQALIAGSFAS